MWNDEYVIAYNYVTSKGQLIAQEFPIHPYYAKFNWMVGTNILFEYAMECEIHYPYSCNCTNLTMFALPMQVKESTSLISKIKKLFKR
jgi:hypothetical protein